MKRTRLWLIVGLFVLPATLPAYGYPKPTHIATWGSPGSGPDEFLSPRAIAVSGGSLVYVVDTSNYRVKKMSREGAFLTSWGSGEPTEGNFGAASGATVDSNGDVYVSDYSYHRIQEFDGDGNFIIMWGWGVDTGADAFQRCATACLPGAPTSGDGGFTWPLGVAFDAWGRVYVVDQVNGRVQVFDEAGAFLMSWGSGGSGDGHFLQPAAVAIGPFQDIYVSDTVNHNLQRFRAHPLWYFKAEPAPSPIPTF